MAYVKTMKNGIPSRLESFKRHCVQEGYELLGEDYRFLDKMLNEFGENEFKAIMTRYLKEWDEGTAKAQSSNTAQGEGRRRANLWLFERCEQRKVEMKKLNEQKASWNECFD